MSSWSSCRRSMWQWAQLWISIVFSLSLFLPTDLVIRYIGPQNIYGQLGLPWDQHTNLSKLCANLCVSCKRCSERLSDSEDKCNPIYVFLHRRVVQAPKVVLLIIMKIWRLCTIELGSWILLILKSLSYEKTLKYFKCWALRFTLNHIKFICNLAREGKPWWLWWSFEIAMGNIDPQSSMIF
jgi:hypothetical protein